MYFVTQLFAACQYIYDLPKSLITVTKQTMKDEAISGIMLLL